MKTSADPRVLTFDVRESAIAFRLDGELSCMISRDDFLSLQNSAVMERLFRLAIPKNVEFEALDNVEAFARVSRLLKKGLILEQAAAVLGVSGEVLRRFWSCALPKYRGPEADKVIERQSHAENDFCATAGLCVVGGFHAGTPIPELFLDALIVHQNIAVCGAAKTADKLHLDHGAFREWLEKNARVLEVLG